MRGLTLLLGAGLLSVAAGCRNCDLVEAELRSRENELRELRGELNRVDCVNDALLREMQGIRQGTSSPISPELASQTYSLKQIALGRGTGGLDEDSIPGDEALQLVLEPRDCDGHIIKAPGSLHVDALEITTQGLKVPLSGWDVSADQLRRTWRSGFLSTGYFVVLPWKNWPTADKLKVVAHFTVIDGRQFEAEKDVVIHPTRGPHPEAPILGEPVRLPEPAAPQIMPAPRKLDPKPTATSRKWWLPPAGDPGRVEPVTWRPKKSSALADAVQLTRPIPLTREPGDDD